MSGEDVTRNRRYCGEAAEHDKKHAGKRFPEEIIDSVAGLQLVLAPSGTCISALIDTPVRSSLVLGATRAIPCCSSPMTAILKGCPHTATPTTACEGGQ